MGERTPHLDATARGGWIGLTARHTRADLIRAVIEGVSYSQKDCLDIIESLGVRGRLGARFGRRRAERVLAATAGRHFGQARGHAGDAGRLGLRRGAAGAGRTGEYASVPEVCRATIREVDAVDPQPKAAEYYRKGHAVYQALYPALKPIYGRLADL